MSILNSVDGRVYPCLQSSVDVGIFLSTTISVDVGGSIHFHRMQCGSAGCIPFPPTALWTCGVYPFTSPAVRRNVGLYVIRGIRYRNELKCRCREQSGTGKRGIQSGTGMLRCRRPECRCPRHWTRCRCRAMSRRDVVSADF